METINKVKSILNNSEIEKSTSNFYFENHECQVFGGNVKVDLEFILKSSKSDEIVNFGMCPHCKTLFYHKDFESKEF